MQKILSWPIALVALTLATVPVTSETQSHEGWGISFPTSAAGEAQHHFVEGVTAMHLFMYEDAAEHFQAAQHLDPDFAMAYWGEALSHYRPVWRIHDREAARAILNRLAPTAKGRADKSPTPREKAYLATLDVLYGDGERRTREAGFAESMRLLSERYPNDTEALAWYTMSRVMQHPRSPAGAAGRMDTTALAQQVLRRNPRHPGALRSLIQSTDDPIHTSLGLDAVRALEAIQPTGSTAIHLPSHVYLNLGVWTKAAEANTRAFDASMAWVRAHEGWGLEALNAHNYGHLLTYAHHAYLQLGQLEKAREIRDRIRDDYAESGQSSVLGVPLARTSARYLIDTERWEDAAELESAARASRLDHDLNIQLAIGLGAARSGNLPLARDAAQRLGAASGRAAELMARQVIALIRLAEAEDSDALRLLEETTAIEDENIMVHFGPPNPLKPPHELYGEVLLELARPADALRQFERSLEIYRRRPLSLIGAARAAAALGNTETARRHYATLVDIWQQADPEHSGLAEVRRVSN